jgi:uncharacterized membrane protein YdbT with pleckstrin-like domain
MRYPTAVELLDGQDSGFRFAFHRSLYSLFSTIFYFAVSLIGVYIYEFFYAPVDKPLILRVLPGWPLLIPIFFLLVTIYRYINDQWLIDSQRCEHQHGRISTRLTTTIVTHLDLRGIAVNQSLLGRIFDFGTIELETSAQEGSELQLEGVPHPERLVALFEELRTQAREQALKNRAKRMKVGAEFED